MTEGSLLNFGRTKVLEYFNNAAQRKETAKDFNANAIMAMQNSLEMTV